ncbi:MAG: IS5 family transposase, partial [Holosporaceae bacterium]|nr:IS5 family transposase [Holosporaceae bacterium]
NIPNDVFQKIYDFLITIPKIHIKNEKKVRIFIEAAHYLSRTGCQVRLLPKEYGNCFCIYQRFLYWKKLGIWEEMFNYFQDADQEYFMIDGTIIRVNQCAAGYKKESAEDLGRSCGGFSTKIHALVDAFGNPVKFLLSPGNDHDITKAEELTKQLKNTKLLADKGYDSKKFVDYLKENGCEAIIPTRSNSKEKREIDKDLYKERHLVENFFSKIKWFRRTFPRFCKTASSFMAFLHFAGALIWLR